jgi:pimeloyl-ACP methyl ester carboxylesterase
MPILAVGGDFGLGAIMEQSLQGAATNLQGAVIAHCGHYIPEEQPQALLGALLPFLNENRNFRASPARPRPP